MDQDEPAFPWVSPGEKGGSPFMLLRALPLFIREQQFPEGYLAGGFPFDLQGKFGGRTARFAGQEVKITFGCSNTTGKFSPIFAFQKVLKLHGEYF